MRTVSLHDKTFELYISDNEIREIVNSISYEINGSGIKDPLFIAVLNGSFLFAADIMRKITIPNAEISFVKFSSYEGTRSKGVVNEMIGLADDISNRNIIVLEDIIDTGNTLDKIVTSLMSKNVNEVKIVTLLYKPDAYKKDMPIHYIGKEIPNDFVVGYGLDYNELGRNLPHIYKLKE